MNKTRIFTLFLVLAAGCKSAGRLIDSLDSSPSDVRANSIPADPGTFTILVAGQSNAESVVPSITSTTGKVWVKRWSDAVRETSYSRAIGINHSAAWIYMADDLIRKKKDLIQIKIVNVSEGGTNSGQWATGYKDRIKSVLLTEHVDVIVWVQGESDVWGGFSQADTYTNYRTILSACQGAPVYVAVDSLIPPEAPYPISASPVRAAQIQIIQEGLAKAGPDLDSLRFNPANMDARGVHFENGGLYQVAMAWEPLVRSIFQ